MNFQQYLKKVKDSYFQTKFEDFPDTIPISAVKKHFDFGLPIYEAVDLLIEEFEGA